MINVELEDASFRLSDTNKIQNRQALSTSDAPKIAVHDAELTAYLERHYIELMALVEERRRPEYADQWEE